MKPRLCFIYVYPIIPLGIKTHIVPTMAMTDDTAIRNQLSHLSFELSSLLKSFKWNAKGKTRQMLKHSAEPKNAIMRSKSGTRIAVRVMTTIVRIRMIHFNMPRENADMPTTPGEGAIARASRPANFSIVLMIGRALLEASVLDIR